MYGLKFPSYGPVDTSSQLMQISPNVDLYLMRQGRERIVILGDGNWLFTTFTHIIYGAECNCVSKPLNIYMQNRPVLLKYTTSRSFQNTLKLSPEKHQLPVQIFSPCQQLSMTPFWAWAMCPPLLWRKLCSWWLQTNLIITQIQLYHTVSKAYSQPDHSQVTVRL